MITNQQMANLLTEKLNTYAGQVNNRPFEFLVHSNEGNFRAFAADGSQQNRSTILINGVLGEQISTPLPLQGLGSTLISQTLMFIIPIDKSLTSGRADYAIQAINSFVQSVAGLSGVEQDGTSQDVNRNTYAYVLSVSTPYVGQEEVFVEVGRAVPVTCQVSWQFIKDGVLANNVRIKLDNTSVMLLDGGITRTRVGDAVNVEGSQEMKTTITQQGLLWEVAMPYKRGDVSETLYTDMLVGNLDRTYDLVYDDTKHDENDNIIQGTGLSATYKVCAKQISAQMIAGKGITLKVMLTTAR